MVLNIKYIFLAPILLFNALLAIESIDLSTKDVYIRKGFQQDWINQHPEKTGEWYKIPGVPIGGQSLSIRILDLPGLKKHTLFSLADPIAESFTYIIPLELDSTIHQTTESLGLYLVGVAYNWEIFFNGISIENKIFNHTNGHLDNPIRGKSRIIPVPNNIVKSGENFLSFHFRGSPAYLGTGMYYKGPYLFGSLSDFLDDRYSVFQYGLVWFYFVIGLFWLYMYLKIPNKLNYFLFAGWTFCISLYNLGRIDHLTVWFNEGLMGFRMEYFGMFLSSFFFFAFIMYAIYQRFTQSSTVAMYYFGGLTFFTFWAPVSFLNDLLRLWEATVPIAIFFLIYHLLINIINLYKNKSTFNSFIKNLFQSPIGYFLIGSFVLFGFLLIDIVLNVFYAEKSSLNIIGFLFFTLSISGSVFTDFIDAHLKAESFNETLETEVQKRTDEIKETKSRIESIYNTASNGLALFDLNLNLIECNQSHLDIFGYTLEEYNNLELEDFYSKKGMNILLENRERILNGKGETFGFIIPTRNKRGEIIQLSIFSSLLTIDGQPIGFVSDMRDITDELRAKDELRKTSEELLGIFHAIPDLFFRINKDGKILNYKTEHLDDLYMPPDQFLGKNLHDILPKEVADSLMESVVDTLRKKEIITMEYALPEKEKPDNIEYYEARMLPVANSQVLSIIRNITRRKKDDESIQSYQKQLKYLSQKSIKSLEDERGRISRELHDEVGQALSAVNLNLQHVKQSMSQKDEESLVIIDECQAMVQSTAENIHRFSFELRPSILDDLGLIPAMKAHARSFEDRTSISIDLIGDSQITIQDETAKTTLYRTFQECLNNVQKHAKATHVDVSISMDLEAISMIIRDNGVGFNPSHLNGSGQDEGLGITGMKERVEYVDGTFILHSQENKGTEIIIQIPCKQRGESNE